MAKIENFRLPDVVDQFQHPEAVLGLLEYLLILEKQNPLFVVHVWGYAYGLEQGIRAGQKPKLTLVETGQLSCQDMGLGPSGGLKP